MKIKELKKQARQVLKGQWGRAALFTLIFSLIYYVVPLMIEINLSGGFEAWDDSGSTPANAQASTFLLSLVLLPLYVGYLWSLLNVVRSGGKLNYSGLWQAFAEIRTYLRLLGVYLLTSLYTVLWTLLLIIPGIIKALAYSQTYFVMKDHPNIGLGAAITESRRLMDGYKWRYFLLQLSFIGWGILCLFTVGIGFLWLAPYVSTTNAAFYNELVNKHKSENV
jgi:uncharacterized membrane protein